MCGRMSLRRAALRRCCGGGEAVSSLALVVCLKPCGVLASAGRTGCAGTSLMSLRGTSMCGDPRRSQYPTRHAHDPALGLVSGRCCSEIDGHFGLRARGRCRREWSGGEELDQLVVFGRCCATSW